jgi:hypothetical protein
LPGVGYWWKVETGKKVRKKPLPHPELMGRITFAVARPDPAEAKPVPTDIPDYRTFENAPENKIVVPKELIQPHQLVVEAKRAYKGGHVDDRMGRIHPKIWPTLDLKVTKGSLDRALRIMDAILKALVARGVSVELVDKRDRSTVVTVGEEKLFIGIDEALKYGPPDPDKSWRTISYQPTGRLILKIRHDWGSFNHKQWPDKQARPVEDCLNEFITGLYEVANNEKARRLERERREKEAEEERQKREDIIRRQQEELAKLKRLETEVANWQKAREIRSYVDAIRQKFIETHGQVNPGTTLAEWIKWTMSHADRFDPLVDSPPSVLDQKVENSYW